MYLIDLDLLQDAVCGRCDDAEGGRWCGKCIFTSCKWADVMPVLRKLPEVEAKTVMTFIKESERRKSERYICSECGGVCYWPHGKTGIVYRFCPHCGREVDGGGENERD